MVGFNRINHFDNTNDKVVDNHFREVTNMGVENILGVSYE